MTPVVERYSAFYTGSNPAGSMAVSSKSSERSTIEQVAPSMLAKTEELKEKLLRTAA